MATAAVVGAGVTLSGFSSPSVSGADAGLGTARAQAPVATLDPQERAVPVSRSSDRLALARPVAKGKLWTTATLDVRALPKEKARTFGQVGETKQVPVTGRRQGRYAEIVRGGKARWVTASYLSKKKVVDPADRPLSDAPCPDGSGIESALQPQSVKVYRAVCAAFPELTTYGGQDGHGEHVNGEAIDFMVPSSSVGERVKDFVYAHHSDLDLFDIIWSQHIWTIQRSGEGFRSMSDRGSATANHYDHVHIKIN